MDERRRPLYSAFDDPAPLYTQIRERLRAYILNGIYRAHQRMPSENEMVESFGVSRITVRQALRDLQHEGLIFKVQGKGTFVSKPKAVQNLVRLEGFGEAMSPAGHETHSRVIGHRVVRARAVIGARLGLGERDEVTEITRVRYLDREPVSLDLTYVPRSIGDRLVREDLQGRDVFVILENDYGIALGNADVEISATLADAAVAHALQIEEGAPVLRLERLTCAADGRPLDFEYLYCRGDAFRYRMRLNRRQAPPRRPAADQENTR